MPDSGPENVQQEDFCSIWERYSDAYTYIEPRRGDIREGHILVARDGEVILDIGSKQDALVAPKELQQMAPREIQALKAGTTLPVYVLYVDRVKGTPIVSIEMAREYEEWQKAQQLLESDEIVQVAITGYNKGGLLCTFGNLQGFVPASQVVDLRYRRGDDSQTDPLAPFVGREMKAKIIEVNRQRRRLVLSERAAQQEWRALQREQLLQEIEAGQVRSGTVSNLVSFGAFVDLGGMDGLVHLSELSWARVEHPGQVLDVGQEVQVLVLNVDQERQRIGLSIKRTQPDPWTQVEDRFEAGQLVHGTVSHLVDFGAFVELMPGVEGLIHISELAQEPVAQPSDVVRPGEELELLILSVDAERHRIGLSLAQASDVPADQEDLPANGENPRTQDA